MSLAMVPTSSAAAQLSDGVAIAWSGPSSCPRDDLDAQVDTRSDAEARRARSLKVDIQVRERAQSFALDMTMESERGRAARNVELASCDEVRRAAAVLIATALTHDLDPTPPEAPEQRGGSAWTVRASALGDLGTLPKVAWGALLGLSYQPAARLQLAVDLRYLAPRATEPSDDALRAQVDLFAGALVGSYTWAYDAFSIGPALELELGALRGRVSGARADGSRSAPWLSAFAGARAGYAIGRTTIALSVLVGAPFTRPAFVWGDDEGRYRTDAFAIRAQLGVSVRLPTKKNAETGQ